MSQFLQLTNLEEITFIQEYGEYATETSDSRGELSLGLANYFEEHEDEFSGGPPTFTIQLRRDMSMRTRGRIKQFLVDLGWIGVRA